MMFIFHHNAAVKMYINTNDLTYVSVDPNAFHNAAAVTNYHRTLLN